MRKRFFHLIITIFVTAGFLVGQGASKTVPTREEVAEKYTWDLSGLFENEQSWDEEFSSVQSYIGKFSSFENTLGKSGNNLLQYLQFQDEASQKIYLLYSYAGKKRDQDLGNTENQVRVQKISTYLSNISKASAFVDPEILSISDKKLTKFYKKTPGLKKYRFYLDDLRRVGPHRLDKSGEKLLSLSGPVTSVPSSAFSFLTNSDFTWGNIIDEKGDIVQMSRGRYNYFMQSSDRRVRHDAYKELYVPFKSHMNTLTALFTGNLKSSKFYMEARNYPSTLQRALNGPNIPEDVYTSLIKNLNNNLEPLHRWASLKKRILKVDELHPYDTYAPLFPENEKLYTYEEAQEIIKEALKPLGDEVQTIIDRAFKERWIDVYENQGKRGGAYSSGAYGAHPYILMNFNGTINTVFTLAHELGHTVHSYLANENQPFIYTDYTTISAEVASTLNEALLMAYLMEHSDSDAEKLTLLQQYIQDIGSTFYRQTRFAEFELKVHQMHQNEEPLTHESLNRVFGDIYQKYWGNDMVVDEEEKLSWSRIPHFYYNYYVYSYAISFATSQLIAEKIMTGDEVAIQAYLNFLKSGGSDFTVELLIGAGVDLTTPEPVLATTRKMDELLDQMEAIIANEY